MKDYTKRNNEAMDEVMRIAHYLAACAAGIKICFGLLLLPIWFCIEVELNPQMTDEQLANLKELALRDDEWDEE